MIIKPQNLFLASVNFCLFLVGVTQVVRATLYQRGVSSAAEAADVKGKEVVGEVAEEARKVKEAVKGAT